MKNITFTKLEIEVLKAFLHNYNPCSSTCFFEDMLNSKKNCGDCRLEKARDSILCKIDENYGSLYETDEEFENRVGKLES